jgi:hypothetical protein
MAMREERKILINKIVAIYAHNDLNLTDPLKTSTRNFLASFLHTATPITAPNRESLIPNSSEHILISHLKPVLMC